MDADAEPQTIERTVEGLESRVTGIEEPPVKVDGRSGQILQLRAEMGSEVSALRQDVRPAGSGIVARLRRESGASERLSVHGFRGVQAPRCRR